MSLLRRSRSSTHNQIHVRKHVFKCWNFKDTHKSNALLHIQNVRWRFFLLIPINSFRMKLFEMKAHKIIYSSRFGNVVHCFQEFIYKQYCVPVWNEMKWIGPFAIPFDSIVCFFVSFFLDDVYIWMCVCVCAFLFISSDSFQWQIDVTLHKHLKWKIGHVIIWIIMDVKSFPPIYYINYILRI